MIHLRRKRNIYWMIVALLVLQLGCAGKVQRLPQPPSDEQRAQFGFIAIAAAQFNPMPVFRTFGKSRSEGAAKAATATVPDDYRLLCFLPFVIVIACFSATIGSSLAIPEEESDKIEALIQKSAEKLPIQKAMAKQVFDFGKEKTDYHFELLEEQGPIYLFQEPDYTALKEKGMDTVLEVGVTKIGFEGGSGRNPSIRLFIIARARVITLENDKEIYKRDFTWESADLKFDEWSTGDGQLVWMEIERGCRVLASMIVEEVFLGHPGERDKHKDKEAM